MRGASGRVRGEETGGGGEEVGEEERERKTEGRRGGGEGRDDGATLFVFAGSLLRGIAVLGCGTEPTMCEDCAVTTRFRWVPLSSWISSSGSGARIISPGDGFG